MENCVFEYSHSPTDLFGWEAGVKRALDRELDKHPLHRKLSGPEDYDTDQFGGRANTIVQRSCTRRDDLHSPLKADCPGGNSIYTAYLSY